MGQMQRYHYKSTAGVNILVLDESTSNLDNDSALIYNILNNMELTLLTQPIVRRFYNFNLT